MAVSHEVDRLLALADRLLAGEPAGAGELDAALARLDADRRALGEKLLAAVRSQQAWQEQVVKAARLWGAGLSSAELGHELRQPLSGILGFAQMLASDPESREAGAWAREIAVQAERMERLIDRVRRAARPAQGGGASTRVGLAVDQALATFPRLPSSLKLEVDLAPRLPAAAVDADVLVQVLVNLVANARDAMEGSGTLRLRAWEAAGAVEILVADQGGGIPASVRERLFQPFVTSKGETGTGLGLFLCRRLLAPWGAELRLVDAPPATFATAFLVRLKVAPAPDETRAAPTPPSPRPRATGVDAFDRLVDEMGVRLASVPLVRRVLVVDDEPGIRRLVRVLLANEADIEVSEAPDGQAALEELSRSAPALMLVDKNLPGIPGLDLARRARARDALLETIVVTGFPTLPSALEAIALGASDYLVKPFDRADLVRERVRLALDRQRGRCLLVSIGERLQPWASALLEALPSGGVSPSGPLARAVGALARRHPEGPGRVAVACAPGAAETASILGYRADPFSSPAQAAAAVQSGGYDVVIVGPGAEHERALELARRARGAPAQVLWGAPLPSFDHAVGALRAGVNELVSSLGEAALADALPAAMKRRRDDAREAALSTALRELGLDAAAGLARQGA